MPHPNTFFPSPKTLFTLSSSANLFFQMGERTSSYRKELTPPPLPHTPFFPFKKQLISFFPPLPFVFFFPFPKELQLM